MINGDNIWPWASREEYSAYDGDLPLERSGGRSFCSSCLAYTRKKNMDDTYFIKEDSKPVFAGFGIEIPKTYTAEMMCVGCGSTRTFTWIT